MRRLIAEEDGPFPEFKCLWSDVLLTTLLYFSIAGRLPGLPRLWVRMFAVRFWL